MLSLIPHVGFFVGLGCFIPILAAGVRRMHDTGHSGWWVLCPIVNIVFALTEGDNDANEYGETFEN